MSDIEMSEGDVAVVLRADGTSELHSAVTEKSLSGYDQKAVERNMGIALGVQRTMSNPTACKALFDLGLSDESVEALAGDQRTTTALN